MQSTGTSNTAQDLLVDFDESLTKKWLDNFVQAFGQVADDVKHRWVSGECAPFATALAKVLSDECGVPYARMSVSVATREGPDLDDSDEDVVRFSHAVLVVQLGGNQYCLDCYGFDADEDWESDFLRREWHLPEELRSTFDWNDIPAGDLSALSAHLASIDGSLPVRAEEIASAEASIRAIVASPCPRMFGQSDVEDLGSLGGDVEVPCPSSCQTFGPI
jgi:hypothetical protein